METKKKRFYSQGWFVILTLFVYFPVGAILMWIQLKFTMKVRIVLTVIFGLIYIDINSEPNEKEKAEIAEKHRIEEIKEKEREIEREEMRKLEEAKLKAKKVAEQIAKEERMKNATPIPYKVLKKNIDKHEGEYVAYTGIVEYIQEEGNETILLLAIYDPELNGVNGEQLLSVEFKDTTEFVDDSEIVVYGVIDGKRKHTTANGNEYTLPKIQAEAIEAY